MVPTRSELDEGETWCIVAAAGSGRRFGSAKQHAVLAGRPVLDRAVSVARASCDGVVVCLPPDDDAFGDAPPAGADVVVRGGPTRSRSVANGLAAVPERATVILVHDAARPLASTALFRRVIDAVRDGADGAVPVVAVVDTIRSVDGGVVDRDRLRAVQTPQGFRASALRAAHAGGEEATDDATLVEVAGGRVVLVEGEGSNVKITGPADLDVAEALLGRSEDPTSGERMGA